MKFLFDIFPVVLFFVAWSYYDIFVATAVAIATTIVQVAWVWARRRRVDNMLWITLAIMVLFGGATLAFRDPTFIKIKPTVLYWAFAAVLIGAQALFGKNLVRAMMEKQITVPDPVWWKLNASWIGFFAVMGVLNLYVAYAFSEAVWVRFKVFGGIGLMLLFVVVQVLMLARHIEDKGTE
ncbi:MAG: septation protein A [Burkholderiales bacterium]|nr:septation protein A [Burkholderiales bacterium]